MARSALSLDYYRQDKAVAASISERGQSDRTTHGVTAWPVEISHCHSDDISEKNKSVRFPVPDADERMSHSTKLQSNYDKYIIVDLRHSVKVVY